MDINNFSREEIIAIDRISKHGELQAMDKVEIVGLTSEKGRHLNGRIAIVNGIDSDEKNDGNSNPYLAKQEDGRYKVTVEFDETKGKEIRPGVNTSTGKLKSYSLKRENLVMHDIGPGTIARDPVGKEILRRHGLDVTSTAEREAADPETAGFFPAILQGDAVRAREILEVMKRRQIRVHGDYNISSTTIGTCQYTTISRMISLGCFENHWSPLCKECSACTEGGR